MRFEVPDGFLLTLGALALVLVALKLYTDWRVRQAEARYPPAGQFVRVGGLRFHYVAPLVIVHGTADRNVPIEQARRLHRAAPDARLVEIEGAGHELMFLHPEAVMDAIEDVQAMAAE